jgi:hypothetical protein
MYARVTLLEIDTLRVSVEDALELFHAHTLPRLHEQPGYRGVYVLTTPEGKGALISLWDTEDQAAIEGDGSSGSYYSDELGQFTTLFRAPPGRERYEVAYVEEPMRTR